MVDKMTKWFNGQGCILRIVGPSLTFGLLVLLRRLKIYVKVKKNKQVDYIVAMTVPFEVCHLGLRPANSFGRSFVLQN